MNYYIKDMAGNLTCISVKCIYDVDDVDDIESFTKDFMRECKKIFPDVKYNQLNIFDKDRNIYMFDFIPDDGYIFDVFINDEEYKEDINYYKNKWKGKMYSTNIIMTEKNKGRNTYNFMFVYCGSCSNLLMSAINENLVDFWNRCGDFLFADKRSKLEYIYETL